MTVYDVVVVGGGNSAAECAFDLYRNLYQVLIYDTGAPNPYIQQLVSQ